MSEKTNRGLAEYAAAQLGKPYWYGTFGNTATQWLLDYKTSQYPSYYGEERMAKYRSELGRRVHDCVGLIKGYLWSDTFDAAPGYVWEQDKSADGMKSVCRERGDIATLPELPGILVFMPGHVGVYIGGGEVVEARGFAYGVVKTALSERNWKTWGKCPYLSYDEEGFVLGRFLRHPASPMQQGEDVRAIQRALLSKGYSVGSTGADGFYGKNTKAAVTKFQKDCGLEKDGIVGPETTKALGGTWKI